MGDNSSNLYRRILLRVGIAVLVLAPMGVIYVWTLLSLETEQALFMIKILLLVAPLLYTLFALFLRMHIASFLDVAETIKEGGRVSEKELLQAERRALQIPYIVGFYFASLYSLGGLAVIGVGLLKGEFSGMEAMGGMAGILACALVGAICCIFYFIRKPVMEELEAMLEGQAKSGEQPPLFVPISVKLTGFFLMIVVIFLSFVGFLSYISLKSMINGALHETQQKKLCTLGPSMEKTAGGNRDKLISMLKMASRSESSYCLAGENFVIELCPTVKPPEAVVKRLSSKPAAEMVIDKNTGWSWAWIGAPTVGGIIFAGWEPIGSEFIAASFRKFFFKLTIATLLLCGGLGFFIAMDITRPLKKLSLAAVTISEGKSQAQGLPSSDDETSILVRAFSRMTGRLVSQLDLSRLMLSSIRNAVDVLSPKTKQMVVIAEQQAGAGLRQVSAAQEAVAGGQQIAAVAKQIAENASGVAHASEGAVKITNEGRQRLDQTRVKFDEIEQTMKKIADAMQNLGDQSKQIGKVISIIDKISDEANILSLNASLEAAGVGEQGRRFRIVAENVHRLAISTAESTRKIKLIISGMQEAVDQSNLLAKEGDDTVASGRSVIDDMMNQFSQIYDSSVEASKQLREIDLMTSQQATASESMVQTMAEVKETVHENSLATGEIKTSVIEIENLILQLKSHLGDVMPAGSLKN